VLTVEAGRSMNRRALVIGPRHDDGLGPGQACHRRRVFRSAPLVGPAAVDEHGSCEAISCPQAAIVFADVHEELPCWQIGDRDGAGPEHGDVDRQGNFRR
jgi:hypothetical protein